MDGQCFGKSIRAECSDVNEGEEVADCANEMAVGVVV